MFNQNRDNNIRTVNKALFKPGQPLWAKNLTHVLVYNSQTKELCPSQEVIGYDVDKAIDLRRQSANIHESNYLCSVCRKQLLLACNQDRGSFYFRHKIQNPDCPLIDGKYLPADVIRAKKFRGNQEGPAHAMMKAILCDLLEQDSRFSKIEVERTIVDIHNERKRPDIKAKFADQDIIFEIQLSTESLKVIQKRADFYAKNNMILIWIFHSFAFKHANMTGLDIAGFNNGNILVLDDKAEAISRESRRIHFSCHWREYKSNGPQLDISEQATIIDFSSLDLYPSKNQAYYFDCATNKKQCIAESKIQARKLIESKLIADFRNTSSGYFYDEIYAQLIKQYFNITASNYHGLVNFLCVLQSAKYGQPIGNALSSNMQIFHMLYMRHKPDLVFIFLVTSAYYGHKLIPGEREHTPGSFKNRRNEIIFSLKHEKISSKFFPNRRFEDIFEELFPEGFAGYTKWARNFGIF